MKSILVLDPGEHTGWCYQNPEGKLLGGTAGKDHKEVAKLFYDLQPDIVVMERFNLYPQMAKSLAWNSFYPCEVIGVIRYLCMVREIPLLEQAPSIKKYFGGFKTDWDQLKEVSKRKKLDVTEHTKDAYQHYRYFLLNGAKHYGVMNSER